MALDGVGPSMALGSQDENGNCADLAAAVIYIIIATTKPKLDNSSKCACTNAEEYNLSNEIFSCQI